MGVISGLGTLVLLTLVYLAVSAPVDKSHSDHKELGQLKEKLSKLESTLKDIESGIEQYVKAEQASHKDDRRELQPEEEDRELREFEDKLSQEDKALLSKLHSKVKYLQAALHKGGGNNPGDEEQESKDISARNFLTPEEEKDPVLNDYMTALSDKDKQLLEKLHSKISLLQDAIHKENRAPNPGEAEEPVQKRENTIDNNVIENLSPQQQQAIKNKPSEQEKQVLLEQVRDNLEKLRDALEGYKSRKATEDKRGQMDFETHDGHFGRFGSDIIRDLANELPLGLSANSRRRLKGPGSDDVTSLRNNLPSVPRDIAREEIWHPGPLGKDKLGAEYLSSDDVSTRFLNDVRYAKSRGVDLQSLIRALQEQKSQARRGLVENPNSSEERQLADLSSSKTKRAARQVNYAM